MRYSIGEFATIAGVSTDTLRLYEKQDIIRPLRDHSNNYRYYNDLDVRSLLMSRWYRSMQIPLQDVSELINSGTSHQVMDRIDQSKFNLEKQIRKSTLLLNKMKEIQAELDQIEGRLHKCQIKQLPGRYRLKQTNQNRLLKVPFLKGVINEWMELLPFSFFCLRIENWNEAPDNDRFEYNWGVTLTEEDLQNLNVGISDCVEYLPPVRCLSSVIRTSAQDSFSVDSFRFMLVELADRGHRVVGDITGKLLLNEYIQEDPGSYLEINIPF
ncbi:MerR family transcriptional regulator [Paenibacillus thiaminolyticus]|uniref:MerR family transcriptional regulator n=1 Tax=Paenibacillus thiaminolyticus TaxID=49283 RepID=A0A3A3H1X5_PANTH|nr:MerR family transcriptional regulator [Paenibacillus thiaminolyticus]RJG22937.1 MerR family transcriptional regulator [Paenibacillus thiaminolyticus]